jgi:EAL domain-containing protein (putative c-di-GMP-specific phosphodiesterase class I)
MPDPHARYLADRPRLMAADHGLARSLRAQTWRAHLGDTLERVEADVRAALDVDEFFLLYQPRVSLQTGHVVAVEALLRWYDPTRGLIGPKAFLPNVRQTPAMVPLGRRVLVEACRAAAAWEGSRPPDADPLVMSVNVTAVEVLAETFTGTLRDILAETGVPLDHLQLELDVSDELMGHPDVTTKLQMLRSRGLRLSVETVHPAFANARDVIDADCINVGRRWVRTVGTDGEIIKMLSALVDRAHRSGAQVCAMGVEEEHQAAALRQIGCDQAQGFLYCEPVMADDLDWLDPRTP